LGVTEVIITGYSPYPLLFDGSTDRRLPHIANKLHKQIQKTALGAETSQRWRQADDITAVLKQLSSDGYTLAAIEQSLTSTRLPDYRPPDKLALLVGREVEGVEAEVLAAMYAILEIPMYGSKESFNVVQAAAMALYHCRFA